MPAQKVMISSTAHDLPEHRKAVSEACRVMKYEPVMMEDLAAMDATAIEASLAMVDEADVYIGIFALRYGHIPAANNPGGISITEMEYRRAVARRKPRLIFVVDEEKHAPGLAREENQDSRYKLTEFKKRVMGDRVVKFFTSPDNLRALVTEALVALEKQNVQWMPEPLPDPDYLPEDGDLPPGSRVQVGRAEYFVGREDILVELAQSLLHSAADDAKAVIKPAVATGAGGIGKTVLAVEFAHRYGRYFYGVHWINLFGVANMDDLDTHLRGEIAANGQRMNLRGFPPDDVARQVQMTLEAWRHTQPRLLILDNAENPQIVRQALRMFPGMRVLVTSRWGEDGDWRVVGVTPRPLDTLTRRQSLTLLRELAPHLAQVSDDDLSRLAARLGDYPLALHLAGRYLDRMRKAGGVKIEAYLRRLDEEGMAHPAFSQAERMHDPALAKHHGTVADCLNLSWELVEDALAQRLFRACGYLAPNQPIPPDLLLALAQDNREALALALTQLVQYGLLAPHAEEEDRLAIHPLLGDFARGLDAQASRDEKQLRTLADTLAWASKRANETGLPANFLPLRPHVEAVAEHAEHAGLEEAAPLWNNLGVHQRTIGDYVATRQNYERSLAISTRIHGPDHPNVAIGLNNLGQLLQSLGDLVTARDHFERALDIDERHYGPDHPNVATRLNNLGLLLQALGDLRSARHYFERVLEILESTLPPDHPHVASTYNNLGGVLQALGDFEAAREHYQRALEIGERIYGPEHPKVALRLNNLGGVLQGMGDLQGARAYYERAFAIYLKVLGPDHPDIATLRNNLGSVLQAVGDLVAARAHYEEALAIGERVFGPEHPKVALRLNNLGNVLQAMGDLPNALRRLERALAIDERIFGPDHPDVAIDLTSLASVMQSMGKLDLARQYLERALRILETRLPPDHPDLKVVRRGLRQVESGFVPTPTMNQLRFFLLGLPGERGD